MYKEVRTDKNTVLQYLYLDDDGCHQHGEGLQSVGHGVYQGGAHVEAFVGGVPLCPVEVAVTPAAVKDEGDAVRGR